MVNHMGQNIEIDQNNSFQKTQNSLQGCHLYHLTQTKLCKYDKNRAQIYIHYSRIIMIFNRLLFSYAKRKQVRELKNS